MTKTVKAEICVVGTGAAGAVLATSLARSGKHVVLLEQGKAYGPEARATITQVRNRRLVNEGAVDFANDWPAKFSSPDPICIGAGSGAGISAVGGTTLHWNGACPRPREDEMSVRTRFGYGRDYPVSYQEIEPWLLRAEHELGVAGDADNPYASPRSGPFPMAGHKPSEFESRIFAPAAKQLGWTTHSFPWAINSRAYDDRLECLRCRYCMACPSGAKYSPDLSHLLRFRKFPNAELLAETKLLRLESSADGRRIEIAHAAQRDGTQLVVKADRYVLAMGGIETPRMLLFSADNHHKNGLGNAGGQLGVGHSDHLMAECTMILKESASHTYGYPTIITDYHRVHLDRQKHGGFFFNLWPPGASEGADSIDLYMQNATTPKTLSLANLRSSLTRGILGLAFLEMDAVNTLTLDPEKKDAWGMPLARLTMKLTDREGAGLDASSKAFEELGSAMNAEAMSLGWTSKNYTTAAHPGGGAAMGSSPDKGACDSNCRVYGTDNLFLAGSAVFPHQPANNPTLSIVAYALRLAKSLGAS